MKFNRLSDVVQHYNIPHTTLDNGGVSIDVSEIDKHPKSYRIYKHIEEFKKMDDAIDIAIFGGKMSWFNRIRYYRRMAALIKYYKDCYNMCKDELSELNEEHEVLTQSELPKVRKEAREKAINGIKEGYDKLLKTNYTNTLKT